MAKIVSASEFKTLRAELLQEEKAATRLLDALAQKRRALPWVKIHNPSKFKFVSSTGAAITLPEAFENRRQLILYHFMPTLSTEGVLTCPGCSFTMDHIPRGDALKHLHSRDTTFIAAAPVPIASITALAARLGWTFPFYSSSNLLEHADAEGEAVSWLPVQGAFALEVFLRESDETVYHTYETYNRGVESLLSTYGLLDLTPLGRQDDKNQFRLHDEYTRG